MHRYSWLLSLIAVLALAGAAHADYGLGRIQGVVTSVQGQTIYVIGDDGMTYPLLVQNSTDIKGPSNGGWSGLHVGDRVNATTFRLDDGRYIATSMVVEATAYDDEDGETVTIEGVVQRRNGSRIWVAGSGGTRVVIVNGQTNLKGRPNRITEIRINDYVRVDARRQGGSLIARAIEFPSGYGYSRQLQGRIVDVDHGDNEIRLDNGAQLRISSSTRITYQGRDSSFGDLREGQYVRVTAETIRGSTDLKATWISVER